MSSLKDKSKDIEESVHFPDLSRLHSQRSKSLAKFTKEGSFAERDKFPGDKPVPDGKIRKYRRGRDSNPRGIRNELFKQQFITKQKKFNNAAKQSARTELLKTEDKGFLNSKQSYNVSQHEIAAAVDITSAQKYFELKLNQFGPYSMNYTRNGRFLLIGGNKGHIAAMDWQTKKLMCEINVMETVQDIQWLHIETMFAVAQKQWTYIYDNQGVELHCLKMLDSVLRLEFLPYHFLLVSANSKGYLAYTDVSVGQKVAGIMTKQGRLDVMCHNPSNAIINLGHASGCVTLWSPNVKEPLVKILGHRSGIRSIAVDPTGKYLATSSLDRTLKIWDLRQYKMLNSYKISTASSLAFSQSGMLAAGVGKYLDVYKDCCSQTATSTYLKHTLKAPVRNLQFCPYEDVLGVGHGYGFSSLLVPGSGEANFDALESNPYQTKKQRKEAEVFMLLEKIQPDLISLDSHKLGAVDLKTLEEKINERNKIKYLQPVNIDVQLKRKKKASNKTGKVEKRKQGVKFEGKRSQLKKIKIKQKQIEGGLAKTEDTSSIDVLSRFKKKKS